MAIEEESVINIENKDVINKILFRTITFTIHKQLYAIDILYIRDIVMSKKIYCIPNSDPLLIGVTNIRGEILPIYSLKGILGYEEEKILKPHQMLIEDNDQEYFIIVQLNNHLFAINIDKIEKNINVSEENYNEGSYMSKWSEDTIFKGVIIDNEDNILMIDAARLMNLLLKRTASFSFY